MVNIRAATKSIKELIKKRQAIVIAGTGVSIASVSEQGRSIASWNGLILNGLTRLEEAGDPDDSEIINYHRKAVTAQGPKTAIKLIEAALFVQNRMQLNKSGEFGIWLEETIGSLTVGDRRLIESIYNLHIPIATTNYDRLIESVTNLEYTTWQKAEIVQSVIRGGPGLNRVTHLHGYYADEDSIIFSAYDYGRIVNGEAIQSLLKSISLSKSIIFVGCGEGLLDPNFHPLLEWSNRVLVDSRYTHYLLCRDSDVEKFSTLGLNQRLCILPYGSEYSDLAKFLENLSDFEQDQIRNEQNSRESQALEIYLKTLKKSYGKIKVLGMQEPIPLDEIIVRLSFVPLQSRRQYEKQFLDSFEWQQEPLSDKRSDLAIDLLEKNSHLYVLGPPGAGKTTFMRYVMLECVDGRIAKIPLMVELADWSQSMVSFEDYFAIQLDRSGMPDAKKYLNKLLLKESTLILFDGLDEVIQENGKRDEAIRKIRTFARNYPKAQIILTCRVAADQYNFEQFRDVEIAKLDDSQIRQFAQQWFSKNEGLASDFISQIFQPQNRGIKNLATTPLLLVLLCLKFEVSHKFPSRKSELYDSALSILFEKWDGSRRITRDEIYKGISTDLKHQFLSQVAWESFKNKSKFIQEGDLFDSGFRFLESLPNDQRQGDILQPKDGEYLVKALATQHGVLIEYAEGVYSFSHLSFHEHYAAKYIRDSSNHVVFHELLIKSGDSRWNEIIELVSTQLNAEASARFFEKWAEIIHESANKFDVSGLIRNFLFQKNYNSSIYPDYLLYAYRYGLFFCKMLTNLFPALLDFSKKREVHKFASEIVRFSSTLREIENLIEIFASQSNLLILNEENQSKKSYADAIAYSADQIVDFFDDGVDTGFENDLKDEKISEIEDLSGLLDEESSFDDEMDYKIVTEIENILSSIFQFVIKYFEYKDPISIEIFQSIIFTKIEILKLNSIVNTSNNESLMYDYLNITEDLIFSKKLDLTDLSYRIHEFLGVNFDYEKYEIDPEEHRPSAIEDYILSEDRIDFSYSRDYFFKCCQYVRNLNNSTIYGRPDYIEYMFTKKKTDF